VRKTNIRNHKSSLKIDRCFSIYRHITETDAGLSSRVCGMRQTKVNDQQEMKLAENVNKFTHYK